jgi:hypothetical protein
MVFLHENDENNPFEVFFPLLLTYIGDYFEKQVNIFGSLGCLHQSFSAQTEVEQ